MTEIEIKFQIPAHQHPALQHFLAQFELNSLPLHAKYYETPNHDLARHHAAIRVRREGNQWIQMLKAKGESDLHRLEYEIPLGKHENANLELHLFRNIPVAQQFLERVLGDASDQLSLQFETDVIRTQALIQQQTSQIELSLDKGEIRSQRQSTPLYEIEFELKQGQVFDLIELCKRWTSQFELWIDVRSKAERGHLLAEGKAVSSAKHYRAPQQQSLHTALTAFQQCFLSNMAAVIAGVAESAHIQALQESVQQLCSQLTQMSTDRTEMTVQMNAWQALLEHITHTEPSALPQVLASKNIQLMLLEQMQVLYQTQSSD